MKIRSIFLALAIVSLSLVSCKKEAKETETKEVKTEIAAVAKMETVSLNISGMTCEIGCAKTIQSKLSKKEGVADAKVVFTDSIATIQFDSNKLSSEDLTSFINGIAGGDLYKATEVEAKK